VIVTRGFRNGRSAAIDVLVVQLELESAERRELQTRVGRLSRECGCAFGGVALAAALVGTVVYVGVSGDRGPRTLALGAGSVVAAALVGKVAGLALASLRLELLRRRLARRLRRHERERRHVLVY